MRACLCLYLYLCLQTFEKKDPKCTQARWSRCTCLSRKRQTKEGPSSKAIINLLSVQIWAAKTSHISAFSCCGTACSLDPDGIPQPNCTLDAQLQNLGKKMTAKWSTELPSTDVVSKHLGTVGTCWNHPHAHHLRTKHTKSWVCCNML